MIPFFKKVLIVDDTYADRFVLKKLLDNNNFTEELIEAESGMKALDLLTSVGTKQSDLPELIFLDVNMGSMNGFQLLELLSKLSNNFIGRFKFVMMCAVNDPNDRKRAFEFESVIGFYVKPFTVESLEQIVERLRHTQTG